MGDYEKQRSLVSEVWGKPRTVKSLWQSKIFYIDFMRRLTEGTAPHFMHYIKRQYFPDHPTPRALSIGCGMGDLDRIGYEAGLFSYCLGLDISEGAIQIAKNLTGELGYPLDYEVVDLNTTTLRDCYAPFDLIFANASLHHMANLEQIFVEIGSVLKPDGLFFFQEYVGPSRFQWKPKTIAISNRILNLLPERFHPGIDRIGRMTYEQFINGDPSEAVHSEEILSISTVFFDPIEIREGGTTLTHPLLNDIIRYFDEDDEIDATILRLIFLFEEILIEERVLDSDTKLAIFRKRNSNLSSPNNSASIIENQPVDLTHPEVSDKPQFNQPSSSIQMPSEIAVGIPLAGRRLKSRLYYDIEIGFANWAGLSVCLATSRAKTQLKGVLRLDIFDLENPKNLPLRRVDVSLDGVSSYSWVDFNFDPIATSAQCRFRIEFHLKTTDPAALADLYLLETKEFRTSLLSRAYHKYLRFGRGEALAYKVKFKAINL